MNHADPFDRGAPRPAGRPIAWARLVPLATLAVLTVAIVAQARRQDEASPAPAVGIGDLPPLPPPDDSPAMQAVRDETRIQFTETAAYSELLDRVRRTPPEELREQARTDVVFSDLLDRPARYRGLPIRLQGTARRILRWEGLPDRLAPEGDLYEAWTFTSDSRGFPYVLVFEEAPEGLPGGDDVSAFVVFHGYFFKLLAYNAADKPRKAPMLIGRLDYVPDDSAEGPAARGPRVSSRVWLLAPVALLVVYLFFRTTTTARSIFGSASRRRFHAPPRDEISPEELDDWLRGAADGGEDAPPLDDGRPPAGPP